MICKTKNYTFFAKKLDHFPCSESRRPVEESLSDIISEVNVDSSAGDGGQQSVRVLAADAVDELAVRLVAARAAAAGRRALAARTARPARPRCRAAVTSRPASAMHISGYISPIH